MCCSLPQLLYPSAGGTPSAAFLPTVTATTPAGALTALPQPPAAAAPHSPGHALAAAIGHPLIEYSTLAFPTQLHASAAGFDAFPAAAPAPAAAAAAAAGFLAQTAAPPSATFTPIAYATPAPSTPGLHPLTHYRPLSIQDRI